MNTVRLTSLDGLPLIKPGDNIVDIIYNNINQNKITIDDYDVFVIAQKIISKSENRYIDLNKVNVSKKAKNLAIELNKNPEFIQAVLDESNKVLSTKNGTILVEHKLGYININAGIDLSNIPDQNNLALLLPEDPSKSAKDIQEGLSNKLNKDISIIVSDSMTRPFRSGVINFALASYNFQSLIDLKGVKDLYNNKIKGTEVAYADELAAAAGIVMGQTSEQKPVILIKGFNYLDKTNLFDAKDLIVDEEIDLYR